MEYKQYLNTQHWKQTRHIKLSSKGKCNACGTTSNLVVHHKTYKDKEGESILFREEQTNLVALCTSCHRMVHFHFGIQVKKLNKKICRVRRLLELGLKKHSAFWIASDNELWLSMYTKILETKKVYKGSGA